MSDRPAPLDHDDAIRSRLRELMGDGTEPEVALVARIVRGFRGKSSGVLQALEAAVMAGDAETAVRQLHLLRGSALNLGLLSLADRCERMETAAQDGELPGPRERTDLREETGSWAGRLTRQADALLHVPGSGGPAHSGAPGHPHGRTW